MPTINNHFASVEMLNVNDQPGQRGPLLVAQRGVAPGDMTIKDRMFLLRTDGKWVDIVQLGASTKPEHWDMALFDSPSQVMQLLDQIGSHGAEVLELDTTAADIEAWLNRTAGLDPMQRVRNLLEHYRKRLQDRK